MDGKMAQNNGGGRRYASILNKGGKMGEKSVREDGGQYISGKSCGRCDPCVSPFFTKV